MPEYLAPGVYVEEVDTGTKPIEGVSTSTAGFVGAAEMGPTEGLPQLVTSMADFQRIYGGFLPEDPWGFRRFLAHSVDGFFRNGGKRVYVQRVVGAGASESSAALRGGWVDTSVVPNRTYLLTRPTDDVSTGATEVRLISTRGIERTSSVTFVQSKAAGTPDVDTYTVSNVVGDVVTLSTPVVRNYRRNAVVRVEAPGGFSNDPTLTVRAANEGAWGDRVRVMAVPSSRTAARLLPVDVTRTVQARPLTANLAYATLTTTNVVLSTANEAQKLRSGDQLVITEAAPGTATHTATVDTIDEGANRVNFTGASAIPGTFTLPGATITLAAPPPQIGLRGQSAGRMDVDVDSTVDLAPGQQVRIEGGGNQSTATVAAVPSATRVQIENLTPRRDYPAGSTISVQSAGLGNVARVSGAVNLYPGAAVELTDATGDRMYTQVASIDGERVTFNDPVPGNFVPGDTLRTAEFDLRVQLTRYDAARRQVVVVREETHRLLSLVAGAFNNAAAVVGENSELITLEIADPSPNDAPFNFPTTIDPAAFTGWAGLGGGSDGAPPAPPDYVGDPTLEPGFRRGIYALEDRDAVSIIAAPGIANEQVHRALIDQCERLKDRFAVLDPRSRRTPDQVQRDRSDYDTRYAAIYYPWIKLFDPLTGGEIIAPPSGHVIGIYARTDIERGVHKAPANAVVRGASDIERVINKAQQDILNPPPNQINVIRDFRSDGRGIRVWGARCITSDSDWKYVNVRRLFIFLEESIDEGTQWVVFEPNDKPLWDRVIQSVSAFLTRVWRDGALQGATPEEAFFVKCDRTTMTQDDIDNGRLIMLIGVAPVKPAEFVIIRIGQWAGGGSVEEQ